VPGLFEKTRDRSEPSRRRQHSKNGFSGVQSRVGSLEVIALEFSNLDVDEISGEPFIDRFTTEPFSQRSHFSDRICDSVLAEVR
jgi:hypothetical protein